MQPEPGMNRVNRKLRVALGISVITSLFVFAPRDANAEEEGDSAAMSANRGLKIGLSPNLLLPMRANGPYGGGLDLEGRYGIKAGPTVLAPGGLLGGYLISSRFIGLAMPTFRVTVPVGPFAPYVLGGIGGGWIGSPSEGGLAYLGGGGMMIHFGRIFALGAEITYRKITNTEFGGWAFGPALSFGGG